MCRNGRHGTACPGPDPAASHTLTAFERAFLGEMDTATRAEVEKRATAGNTISGVIATILLNDNQMVAKHGKAGAPITVIAIDFVRGVIVIENSPGHYEPVRFDPKTLTVLN